MGKLSVTVRGKYFKQHLKNVVSTVKINFADIKPGMILLITYHSERRTGPKQSLYVCIQPIYQHFVHCLDLDYVLPSKNSMLLGLTKTKRPILHEQNAVKKYTRLEFVSKDRTLYDSLRRITGVGEAYRRLHRDTKHIKTIEAVTYKFKGFDIEEPTQDEAPKVEKTVVNPEELTRIKEKVNKEERPSE